VVIGLPVRIYYNKEFIPPIKLFKKLKVVAINRKSISESFATGLLVRK
jgi:hypothetical protein